MKHHPIPTIIVSSLTPKGCETALSCLEAGAVDVMCKPGESYTVGEMAAQLANVIRAAATARIRKAPPDADKPRRRKSGKSMIKTTRKVIALGASAGGNEALRVVLCALPKQTPGIVMAQHMPAGFTTSFARRLDDLCAIEVREAADGD